MVPLIIPILASIAAIAATEQTHPRTKIQNAINDATNQRISPQEANQRIAKARTEFIDLAVASQPDEPRTKTNQQTEGVSRRERIISLYNSGQLTEEQMNWFKENNYKIKE